MSKNILDYVMESPENTNPAVLGSLLDKENVQADWNQNDESARDYVKNRPFYTGNPVETVLVEEQTVAFSDMNGGYVVQGWPTEFDVVVGETYTVSWDGTEYECECLSMQGLPYIGNLAIAGSEIDTGEPFIFIMNQGAWGVGTNDTASEHSISVSSIVHPVTKIDEKYLPTIPADKSPALPVIEFTTSIHSNIANDRQPYFDVLNLSYSEIYSIVEKGNFQIKDSVGVNYRPIISKIGPSGIDVGILSFTAAGTIYATLVCDADQTSFYRDSWWQIEATQK